MIHPSSSDDPFVVFADWYAEHQRGGAKHPDAMSLATATADGRPSLRTVLLKGVVGGAFRFFTSYDSRKGVELAQNPRAALLFHWPELERQVRVEGRVERVPATDSDEYFATRPRESQLSAAVSPQSRPIPRAELVARRAELELRLAGEPVPRPSSWGGFALFPEAFELWMADPNRLHERYLFTLTDRGWRRQELGP